MKKNVIRFGLISGLILTSVMVYSTTMCYTSNDFESSMWLGYASMVLAFSLIYVGVKNYRDKYNNGFITFGKAFRIGLYISIIASTMYVLAWLVDYYLFMPDFMDRYTEHVMKEFKADGATPQEISVKAGELNKYTEMYKNPVLVILLTYTEVLPVGIIISLICALFLKKKHDSEPVVIEVPA